MEQPAFTTWFCQPTTAQCAWQLEDMLRSGRRFARRIWLLRGSGNALSFLFLFARLATPEFSDWGWLALFCWAFLWPQLAWQLAQRSADPRRAEYRHLLADAAMSGGWLAMLGLNPLPGALLVMISASKIVGAGGLRLLAAGLLAQASSCGLVLAIGGIALDFTLHPVEVWACLPALVFYPLGFALIGWHTVVRLGESKSRLQRLCTRDGMTGLYNRHHWETLLAYEFDNCLRYQRSAVLVLLDIDHFKLINDSWGHATGDKAIASLTRLLVSSLRISDVAGRFGGDEFAVIMSGTDARQASDAMCRLHNQLQHLSFPEAGGLRLHISVGVAQFNPQMIDYREWLKAADKALYKAKRAGRNRTEIFR